MTTSRLRPAALTLTLSLAALPAAVAHAATQTLSHAGIATYTVRADAGIRATWIERRHPSAPVPVLREATAAPGASTFGAAHTLAVLSSDAGPVDMTTDAQGGHVLVWDASAGSWPHKVSRGVWFSIVRPDGTRTPKRQLNAPGSRAKFSAVRGNAAGDALACWWQRSPRAQPWKARSAIRRAGSGHFGPATTLSFHQVTPPQLYPIVNGEGRLLVVSELSRSQILAVQGTLRDGWGARTVISPDRRAHFKYDYNFDPIQSIFNVAMAPDGSATVAFVENEPATGVMFQNAAHVVRLNAGGGVAQRQALGVLPEGDAEWTAPVLTTWETAARCLRSPATGT